MKKVCFIVSHLNSGSPHLFDQLCDNPRVMGYRLPIIYNHPTMLDQLTTKPHKLLNSAAVYVTEVLYNWQLCHRGFYDMCRFIYMIREPEGTLNQLVRGHGYQPDFAVRYYCYRLRRICEMAKRTPGAVLLTYTDMATGEGLHLVDKYLSLKQPLAHEPDWYEMRTWPNLVGLDGMQQAQRSYERHLHYLRHLDIIRTESHHQLS